MYGNLIIGSIHLITEKNQAVEKKHVDVLNQALYKLDGMEKYRHVVLILITAYNWGFVKAEF
jgi:SpoVK/Ycf46/Vps4 family AAA+-type ATPase